MGIDSRTYLVNKFPVLTPSLACNYAIYFVTESQTFFQVPGVNPMQIHRRSRATRADPISPTQAQSCHRCAATLTTGSCSSSRSRGGRSCKLVLQSIQSSLHEPNLPEQLFEGGHALTYPVAVGNERGQVLHTAVDAVADSIDGKEVCCEVVVGDRCSSVESTREATKHQLEALCEAACVIFEVIQEVRCHGLVDLEGLVGRERDGLGLVFILLLVPVLARLTAAPALVLVLFVFVLLVLGSCSSSNGAFCEHRLGLLCTNLARHNHPLWTRRRASSPLARRRCTSSTLQHIRSRTLALRGGCSSTTTSRGSTCRPTSTQP
eukprot:m.131179 g.131179  ORF g.131179 m.131179 type:complete len:321 (+) comp9806_c0_seq5:81-1043(+)